MAQSEAIFLNGSLLRHVVVMASAASVGLLAIFVVDLVDMLFISMLGNEALAAAVGYAGAILFFTTSLSIGLAITAGALVSRSLGAGRRDLAREQTTHVLLVGLLVAGATALAIRFNLPVLTGLVGASGGTQVLAQDYLGIVVPAMPFLTMAMLGSAVLRAHGDARTSMWVTLSGGFVNAVLDPILIFGLAMGLDGAAWATVAAHLSMCCMALWPIVRKHGGLARPGLAAFRADLGPIFGIALPAVLANIATPVGAAYVTRAAAAFGQEAVAGMAIIARLTPVAFAMIFALSGAIGPILGQNFGARRFDRVRRAYNDAILFIAAYVVVVVLMLFLARNLVVDVFSAQGLGRNLIILFCGPLSLAWIFNGVIFVGNAAYNNLGHPYYSMSVNWARNTIGVFPFVYAGARIWGAEGVLIGQMAGGTLVAFLSYWLARRTIAEISALPPTHVERRHFAGHNRIFQLFNLRR